MLEQTFRLLVAILADDVRLFLENTFAGVASLREEILVSIASYLAEANAHDGAVESEIFFVESGLENLGANCHSLGEIFVYLGWFGMYQLYGVSVL